LLEKNRKIDPRPYRPYSCYYNYYTCAVTSLSQPFPFTKPVLIVTDILKDNERGPDQ